MLKTKAIQMVDLYGQYLGIQEEVDAGMKQVIESSAYINGPAVKNFSSELGEYLDAKHVIPCANGTDALQIAMMALGLKPGDEVITVAFTFVATVEVIALLQLKPVFVDIDPDTYTLDVSQVEAAITEKTKCILPVHLFGQTTKMEPLLALAKKHNLHIIEDNAQAIGADYIFEDGSRKKAGIIGDIGSTSFYPSKNLGCYGDGGALFTNNDELGENIRMVANHGMKQKYQSLVIGVNSRLDSFQGVVLSAKLKKLNEYGKTRQSVADFYDAAFSDDERIKTPYRAPYSTHVFHQYTIVVEGVDREVLRDRLKEKGVPTMVYYPNPLHLQKPYLGYGFKKGDLPHTERLAKSVVSLPMHTELDEEQLNHIKEAVLASI